MCVCARVRACMFLDLCVCTRLYVSASVCVYMFVSEFIFLCVRERDKKECGSGITIDTTITFNFSKFYIFFLSKPEMAASTQPLMPSLVTQGNFSFLSVGHMS